MPFNKRSFLRRPTSCSGNPETRKHHSLWFKTTGFQDGKDIILSGDDIPNLRGWELSDRGEQSPERLSLSAKGIMDSVHVADPSWAGPREQRVFNVPSPDLGLHREAVFHKTTRL
jgi:hypothetical protein